MKESLTTFLCTTLRVGLALLASAALLIHVVHADQTSRNSACATSITEIHNFTSIKASSEYRQWKERIWEMDDIPDEPFGMSLGHSDFVSEKFTKELIEKGSIENLEIWDAVLLRSFLANQEFPELAIIPPHKWLRNQQLRAPKYLPTKAAAEMTELTLKIAEERGTNGPLFFFFLDDFQAHILANSKIRLKAEELASNERLVIERNGIKIEEGYTEAEFRILFRNEKLFERSQFFLKQKALDLEEVSDFLNIPISNFPSRINTK